MPGIESRLFDVFIRYNHNVNRSDGDLRDSVSVVTLAKASLQSEACVELRGLLTLSFRVMMERLVKLESSSLFLTLREQAVYA